MRSLVLGLLLGAFVGGAEVKTSARLPRVLRVFPQTQVVHENLLRISIVFAEPPDGEVLSKICLIRSDGTAIDEPFLNQELWTPDGRTLTVLFGPGRVKTGLVAHDTLGRPLRAGEEVSLQLDGNLIADWKVDGAYVHPIESRDWKILPPKKGGRLAATVIFPEPIDGMDAALIGVARSEVAVAGRAKLKAGERIWRFVPERPWRSGHYTIVVHPHLEDPYGNEPGSAFETPKEQSGPLPEGLTRIQFDVR